MFGSEIIAMIEEKGIEREYGIYLDGGWSGDLVVVEMFTDETLMIVDRQDADVR